MGDGPLERPEAQDGGEISLPLGIRFKGQAAKQFWNNLGWVAFLAVLAFAMWGPPKEILERLTRLETKFDQLTEKVGKMEGHRYRAEAPTKKPVDFAQLKGDSFVKEP